MLESYAIYTTGAKRQAQRIDVYFKDQIKGDCENLKLNLFEWTRIDELKKQLAKDKFKNHLSWGDLRLFYKNIELLPDNRRLFDFGIQPESMIVVKCIEPNENIEKGIVNPYQIFTTIPEQIKNLLLEVQSGLNNGKKPKLAQEGTSGTYFLENHMKKIVAIFKPYDEEPFADNNPRGYTGKTGSVGMRSGILSGESATRQVASYLLDSAKFHGVPETTFVQFFHPTFINKTGNTSPIMSDVEKLLNKDLQLKTKHGSLQAFMQSHDIVGNMGSNQFDVEQIHKIGILDLRILNCDRNQANILVRKVLVGKEKKKALQLIPIDHGLSFSDSLDIYDYQMVWMSYRQASKPFSEKSLRFIESIDPIKDCQMLKQKLGFRQICLRNFRIAEMFLKKMAREGYTLYQIGEMVYRKDDEEQQDEINFEEDKQNKNKNNLNNRSDFQRLVSQTQNMYWLMKQNGIKTSVNFNINFVKNKKKEQSLPEICENGQQQKQQIEVSTSLQKKNSEISKALENNSKLTNRERNTSLPNLKIRKQYSKLDREKRRAKKLKGGKEHLKPIKQKREEKWQEMFYHYFDQFLDHFIEKKKKKNHHPLRSRIMSEQIDFSQFN